MNKEAVLEGLLFVVGEDGLTIGQISEILEIDEEESKELVKDLKERFMVGDVIRAKVIDIDSNTNHLKLSIKEIDPKVKSSKSKIEESGLGFELLETNLPIWVDKKMKELTK